VGVDLWRETGRAGRTCPPPPPIMSTVWFIGYEINGGKIGDGLRAE
jgi:hypothetical protein